LAPSAAFDAVSELVEVVEGAVVEVADGPPLKSVAYQPEPFS
jgi:hypothetical protein